MNLRISWNGCDPTVDSNSVLRRPPYRAKDGRDKGGAAARGMNHESKGWATRRPRYALLPALVAFHLAVANVDDAVGVFGDVVFVGDQDDGITLFVQAVKERHDFGAGL